MLLFQQIAFILVLVAAVGLFTMRIRRIRRNILLGRDEDYSGDSGRRWTNVILLTTSAAANMNRIVSALSSGRMI